MKRCKHSRMLAISVSELDAAEEAGVSLKSLFRNDSYAWRCVANAFDRRQISRESVGLGIDRTGRIGNVAERAEEAAARAQLLTDANRPVFDSIAADDAQRAARQRAELAVDRRHPRTIHSS